MQRRSLPVSIAFIAAAIGLSACNQTTGSQAGAPTAAAAPNRDGITDPNWPPLPEGAACSDDLNRYQTIVKADANTGNLNRSVYVEIESELQPAAEACAAGRDAEARKLVQASKARHGYRA